MAKAIANDDPLTFKLKTCPVAIIGMASIFPKATNLSEYWDNILRKIDCIINVPTSRWNINEYYDPNPSTPDKTYCKRGGFIPDIDFDPTEFGLPPNILEVTDVSQLLGLVTARDAMEDAGYGENRQFDRQKIGVMLGVVGMSTKLFTPLMARLQYPVWEKVLKASGVSEEDTHNIIEKIKLAYVGWEENSFPGTIANVIAGRIANRLDLGGTNLVTDAACGSSLAAVKLAVGELVLGRADMMISGGVDLDNSINTYMCFSKTPAFSKGEHVRTFDANSDGMMVGEGIGMVVLKRLADAERDNDRIYAVIKGVGSSSDGRFKSIYAPRPEGQALAVKRAYDEAGFPSETVGLIEAHGTGTLAGDPAEFNGLKEVFCENNSSRDTIALGSVKSQIGHTKAAAGIASLIKTSLALYHKVLPPTINVAKPNPKLGIEETPFYINTESRPWIRRADGAPRRAGVSSFGFGGTNFHIALEEYRADENQAYRVNDVPSTIILNASDPTQLLKLCQETFSKLEAENSKQYFAELVNQSRGVEIPLQHARLGFIADTLEDAQSLLKACLDSLAEKGDAEAWENPKGIFYRRSGYDPDGKVVALFSGQGSQYVDMGRELAMNFPPIRKVFGSMDELFVRDGKLPLTSVLFPAPAFSTEEKERQNLELQKTENAQPSIGSFSVGLFKTLQEAGLKADYVAGHSFGELTALWASGVLDDDSYLILAKARGKAMAPPADPNFDAGSMLAVKGDVARIREEIQAFPDITLANWNSNNQVALAGPKSVLSSAQQVLTEKGFSVVPLQVSAAFHTSLVGHAQKPFAAVIKKTAFNTPDVKVFSNTTGKLYPSDPQEIKAILEDHILKPVLFKDEIENIYAEGGFFFVEFGPKNVLTNLVKNILAEKPHMAIALNANAKKDSDRQLREAVLQLRIAGLKLKNFDPYQVPLSTKPPRKKSAVTVTLNGGLYITEKTRSSFQKALMEATPIQTINRNGNEHLQAARSDNGNQAVLKTGEPAVSMVQGPVGKKPKQTEYTDNPVKSNASYASIASLEKNLIEFEAQQKETLRLHEQFLQNDAEYGRIFANLTQMQISLLSDKDGSRLEKILPALENFERSMMRFHEHQAETLRVHDHYLKNQAEFAQAYIDLVKQQADLMPGGRVLLEIEQTPKETPPPIAEEPVVVAKKVVTSSPVEQVAATQSQVPTLEVTVKKPIETDIASSLLKVVSEKTGYPVEMLESSMDMEADLGIDSIKRVEILGAMQALYPELPKIEPETLAELRTLGQITDHLSESSQVEFSSLVKDATPQPDPVVQVIEEAPATSPVPGLNTDQITQAFLQTVSEKTGYPIEMLELSMDMEADLGIDSIKRVEILGAIQAQFPDLPKIEPETLAELRTLGQVTSHLAGSAEQTSPF